MVSRRRFSEKTGLVAAALVSLIAACALPARACAADPETLADVRCVLVALHTAALNVPAERVAGAMAAIYYLGRLDGHAPRADVEKLIEREARNMTSVEIRVESARCGGVLVRKGHELQKIGAALSRGAQNGPAPKKRPSGYRSRLGG